MANPVMGEVAFEAGGKKYIYKLGTYAQMLLERRTKKPMTQFFNRKAEEWGVEDIVSVFWAGLQRKHPMNEEQVADLIDEVGIDKVMVIVTEGLDLSAPKIDQQGAAGESAANPPQPEASQTGTASSPIG